MKIARLLFLLLLLGASTAFYLYKAGYSPTAVPILAPTPTELVIKRYKPFISPASYNPSYIENDAGQDKHSLRSGSGTRSYNAYMPSGIGEGPHPAVFLFHGGQRTGASMIEKWIPRADKKKFIIIAPHGLNGAWNEQDDANILIPALIEDAASRYPIDKERIFMFGHSAGGNLVNYASVLYPDIFKAAAIHAGAIHESRLPKAKWGAEIMPIIYINGTHDDLFKVKPVKNSAETMARRGHDTELVFITNHNHWYYDLAPQVNAIAWEFFERKSL